jgi:hypothetical protein
MCSLASNLHFATKVSVSVVDVGLLPPPSDREGRDLPAVRPVACALRAAAADHPLVLSRGSSSDRYAADAERSACAFAQTQQRGSAELRQPRDDRIPGERSSRRAPSRRCLWRRSASPCRPVLRHQPAVSVDPRSIKQRRKRDDGRGPAARTELRPRPDISARTERRSAWRRPPARRLAR